MSSSKERRIDLKFSLIGRGLTAEEIDSEVARRKAHGRTGDIRGEESEQTVQYWLKGLRYIHSATILPAYMQQFPKKDIEVKLHWITFPSQFDTRIFIPKSTCWVEVKSSNEAVETYKELTRDRYELHSDELQPWLYENRQIILNGQAEKETNLDLFKQQLVAMNEYWKFHH